MIKFGTGGRDVDKRVTEEIEEVIKGMCPEDVKSIPYADALAAGIIREGYPFNEYIDSILRLVDVEKIRQANLRVAIDTMYGVGHSSLRTILLTCRCDVDVLHEQHDTLFDGRMPAPSEDALKQLSNFVVDNRYHLGIATDGDADRLGVIDENGKYLHAKALLVSIRDLMIQYMERKTRLQESAASVL